jgi:DNA polymerase-1
VKEFKIENTLKVIKEGRKAPLKYSTMKIKGLAIKPSVFTASGLPSTDTAALKLLCSDDATKNILAYIPGEKGVLAKQAVKILLEHRSTETLLNTFIKPLIVLVDRDNRIHTSLNINTETGRISSRNPNLLNQPTLDKDRFKIRMAFRAS